MMFWSPPTPARKKEEKRKKGRQISATIAKVIFLVVQGRGCNFP